MSRFLSIALMVGIAPSSMSAEPAPWPQFRGVAGSGIADGKPPVEFGPTKNVKWKVAVPSGLSSPVIVGEKLVLTAFEKGKLFTIAYSLADGKELWRAEAPAKLIEPYHKTEGSPAASTVATDGDKIVSYFGSCGLFCYDLAGQFQWKYEFPMAQTVADFGTGVSPVLADGLVILQHDDTKDSKIVAVDLATGSRKWEKKRQSPNSSFGSPFVWDTPSGKQVVTAGYGRMIAYDLKTGDEKWTIAGMPAASCTTPMAVEGLLLYAGWSPGDSEDKDFKMPSFDKLLEADADKDGKLSKAESEKSFLNGFFDNNDPNKDGFITRDEWVSILKMMSAGKNSAFAVKPGGSGEIGKSHVVWKKTKGLPYVPTGIVYKGQFTLVKDGGLVTVYEAKTGNEVYVQERAVASGRYYASPVAANGNIYFTCLDDGAVTVLKAGTEAPEVVAKNPKLGERTAATPAIAGDTLYIRTAGHLYAFAEKK